jgi:hypothetical protein
MMRGMKKLFIILGFWGIASTSLAVAPQGAFAAIIDDGPKPPSYDFQHELKYTDSKFTTIKGTIQNPISKVTPSTEYTFSIDRTRTSKTSDYRCVFWFNETPKGAYSWYEISALGGCDGVSPSNHKLYSETAAGVSISYDITVSDYQGAPIDNDSTYTPPPITPGTTTTEEGDTFYNLDPGNATPALQRPTWKTVFGGEEVSSYEEWLRLVWNWSMLIMIPLSVLILSAAGVLYSVSEGDSKRIETAKRLILGVVSGVGLLILSRVLIAVILGSEGVTQWWIFL